LSRIVTVCQTAGSRKAGLITSPASSGSIDDVIAELTEQIRETSPQGSAETMKRLAADSAGLAAL
jgi:hypothetical protein